MDVEHVIRSLTYVNCIVFYILLVLYLKHKKKIQKYRFAEYVYKA